MEGMGWLSGDIRVWVRATTSEGTPSHTPVVNCLLCFLSPRATCEPGLPSPPSGCSLTHVGCWLSDTGNQSKS